MRCITSPTSRPHCHCQQSQWIEVLAYTDLTQCNEHYRRRHLSTATSYDLLLSRCLQAPHCQHCLPSPSNLLAKCHPLIPRQTLQESLSCICTQAIIVRQLIVMLGPNFRVSYMPAARLNYRVVTTPSRLHWLISDYPGILSCWRSLGGHPIHPSSQFSPGGFLSCLIINGKLPDVRSFPPFDKNCDSGKISKKLLQMHTTSPELRVWISLRSSMSLVH